LEKTPAETFFIIENAGNRKIGKTVEEIGYLLKLVKSDRVRVCLDTCHLYSAGYDLSGPDKLDAFLRKFDREVGMNRVELFHLNDSKDPFGSFRDRHENIGQGTLGLAAFRSIVNHPELRNLPFIIETPGFDNQGPDKKNLDILESLVQ
jgi:deoxyribonuclease-4